MLPLVRWTVCSRLLQGTDDLDEQLHVGILFAAFLFGALDVGTSPRQLDPEVFNPELATNLATMIQALIIAFVGAEFLILYLWRARKRVGWAGPRRVEPELKP